MLSMLNQNQTRDFNRKDFFREEEPEQEKEPEPVEAPIPVSTPVQEKAPVQVKDLVSETAPAQQKGPIPLKTAFQTRDFFPETVNHQTNTLAADKGKLPGSELLRQAVSLVKSGEKSKARVILASLVNDEPLNETAWLWLSVCVETDKQKIECLNRVLSINPNHPKAKQALVRLGLVEEPELEEISSMQAGDASVEAEDVLNLADMAKQAGNFEEAYQYYTQAVETEPNNLQAWVGKGLMAGLLSTFEKSRIDEAESYLRNQVLFRGEDRKKPVEETLSNTNPALLADVADAYRTLAGHVSKLVFSQKQNTNDIMEAKLNYLVKELDLYDYSFFLQKFAGMRGDMEQEFPGSKERILKAAGYALSLAECLFIGSRYFLDVYRQNILTHLKQSGIADDFEIQDAIKRAV